MFIIHVLISGISWKVTLIDRIYIWSVLCLSEEILLLGPPPPTFPFATYSWDFKLNTLTTVYSFSDQSTSSAKAQSPIYSFRPLSLQKYFRKFKILKYTFRVIYLYVFLVILIFFFLIDCNIDSYFYIIIILVRCWRETVE